MHKVYYVSYIVYSDIQILEMHTFNLGCIKRNENSAKCNLIFSINYALQVLIILRIASGNLFQTMNGKCNRFTSSFILIMLCQSTIISKVNFIWIDNIVKHEYFEPR